MKREGNRPEATDEEAELVLEGFEEPEEEESTKPSKFKRMDEEDIEALVGAAVDDALDFISEEIAEQRMRAQRYFDGEVDIGEEEGRSSVVSTKARDVVRAVKPSIQRVFMTVERPIDFRPSSAEDVLSMEQASLYAAAKFRQADGYAILRDVTHDALVKKVGFTKAYWQEYDMPRVYRFVDVDDEQYQSIISSPGVTEIEHEAREDEEAAALIRQQVEEAQMQAQAMAQQGQPVDPAQLPQMPPEMPQLHTLTVIRRNPTGKLCIDTVPPECFFIDREARSITDFYVVGTRMPKRVGDVIAMGIDEDMVVNLDLDSGASVTEQEEEERRKYPINRGETENALDPAMRQITLTEAFMRMDIEGTGMPVLHKFLLGGTANKLLHYEPVDDHDLAGWHVDPEPHTFFGRSLVEIVEQSQDAATSILRGILDNVQMTNNPRTEAVKGQVEIDDLLNNEIGGIVRVNAPGMIRELTVPFVAGQTLPALQYLDQDVEVKTGVTRASMGLDPDALQSTTRAAVTATVSAAAGQLEVLVANLAYTGMRRLFQQIIKLQATHSTKAEMIRINGTYIPMDPRVWDGDLDAEVGVGLGTGQVEARTAVLGTVMAAQKEAIAQYGPQNPLAGLPQLRNTMADIMTLNGVHNVDRYLLPIAPPAPPAPEAPPAPPPGDPAKAMVEAETIKAQAKMQTDMLKAQLDMEKAKMTDDRERDRMLQDLGIAMAQIAGKYGMQLDTQRIKAEQAMNQQAQALAAQPPAAPAAPAPGGSA